MKFVCIFEKLPIFAGLLGNNDPYSVVWLTRRAILWRKESKVLNHVGYLDFIETSNPDVIAFIRSDEDKKNKIALCFNFTQDKVKIKIPLSEKKSKTVTVSPLKMFQLDLNTDLLLLQKNKIR